MAPPPAGRRRGGSLTLDELAAISLDYLAVADLGTSRFLWLSSNWQPLLGWPLDELQGGSFLRFVHPDDVGSTGEAIEGLTQGLDISRFVNRYLTRDGSYRRLEWSSSPFGDGRAFAVARDVTSAERHEHEATERARLLELASEVGRIGYWRVDIATAMSGRSRSRPAVDSVASSALGSAKRAGAETEISTLSWSSEVFRIHGRDPRLGPPTLDEALGFYHPDDRDVIARAVDEAIREHREFDVELRIVRVDGTTRLVNARGRVELGRTGMAASVFGTLQDVTDERHTQAQLRRSERLVSLGTLAAGVAHEINNPLTYVIGNLSMLVEELEHPELRQMAQDAAQGADHVRRIVDGLRSFSRVSESHEREAIALDEVIAAAVQLSAHQIRHRAELTLDVQELSAVFGERASLVQVFCNLLINAAQAVPVGKRGHVRLRARTEGSEVVVDVEDDGPGIPEGVRERVFDPFFTTKDVGEGTGLGLSICLGTVEAHGGTLRVVDSRPGFTCFQVRLPVHEDVPREEEPLPSTCPERETDPALVVVIDDEPQVTHLVTRALGVHEVRAFPGAEEAMAAITGGLTPDVIVCDLMMPGMPGWQLDQSLRQTRPELVDRVIYVTGGAFAPEGARFLAKLRPSQRLLKPFLPSELRRMVRDVIESDGTPQ